MHFDFPERISLSFSLYLNLQKLFGSRSDPNGIQERMFHQFKNLCKRYKVRKVSKKADADAHKNKDFLALLKRIPWNSQNYQASIQRWAVIGTPVKRHFPGRLMMARF